jgi:hypothetical protein
MLTPAPCNVNWRGASGPGRVPAGRERLAQIELARSQELINDVPNFTNGQPVIQIGDVVASSP